MCCGAGVIESRFMKRISLLLACVISLANMASAEPREWTDVAGRKIKAYFGSSEGGQVTLLMNGKEFKFPIEKLSEPDQAYLKVVATTPSVPVVNEDKPSARQAPPPVASGKVLGPIRAEGSSYYYCIPSSVKPGRKVPLLIYMGAGGGTADTVKGMIEGAEICGWIVACSVESNNDLKDEEQQTHVKHAVDDLLKTQPIDAKRLYFTGNSGGARVAFTAAKTYDGAGVLAIIAGAGDGEISRSKNYFIISGATDYNRYDTAISFSEGRKVSAYRLHAEGHSNGPDWLMTEGMVWLQSAWNVKNPQTPERGEYEAAAIKWIETTKGSAPHRAAWWARHFKTAGVRPEHVTKVAALDAEDIPFKLKVACLRHVSVGLNVGKPVRQVIRGGWRPRRRPANRPRGASPQSRAAWRPAAESVP